MPYTHWPCRLPLHSIVIAPIRLQVLTEDEAVDNVNDNYWTLRIEPIPEDQVGWALRRHC